ncbi:MAG: hypothetical protein LAP61_17875 [Acidobacteriia bacterium]|nr:hypothetical protein [Terriglobia bacterium]
MTSHPDDQASLLVLEAGFTLLAGLMAFCWPKAGSRWFAKIEKLFGSLARRRAASIAVVGAAAMLLRLAILPLEPIPQPFIHDEFSYLLAADTFASGRLTNPTHPMWTHFESFHIDQQPTYMSMYFPAQGLMMAAGQVLFGHPWYGVLLSVGLMCATLCWMFQGWLPPGWALLGGMLAVIRLGLFSNWVNGYYGGAIAATGGALVLGALPRMRRVKDGANARDGMLMALGAIILANSRPYEGLLVCAPAVAWLCWKALGDSQRRAMFARNLIAPSILLAIAAGLMAHYDQRVFGNALTLPYQTNRMTYASAPVFVWEWPRPAPEYRSKEMHDFFQVWEMRDFRLAQTLQGFSDKTVQKLATALLFFFGFALLFPLIMLPRLFRDSRVRYLLIAGAVFGLGLGVNAWFFPHYAAPFTGAVYVLLLQCMRHLRQSKPIGRALVRYMPLVCLLLAGIRMYAAPLGLAIQRWPSMWYGTEPLGLPRAKVAAQLEMQPGKQLAIVRYSPEHAPFDDWVYNKADIDASKVVWARELHASSNADLLQYFRDRLAWLVEPDFDPPRVSPYSPR